MSLAARSQPNRRAALFPGWWVVMGGFGLLALSGLLFFQSFGAYFVQLQEEFGWNLTLLSGAFALTQVVAGAIGPVQGWLVDRLGVRTVVRVGLVLFGFGLVLFALIQDAVSLYAVVFVISVGATLAGWVTINVAAVQWFRRRRAAAMGLISIGFAAGGLLVPVVAWALETFGWRHTSVASGLLAMAVGLPITQWLKSAPETYGLLPDGRAPGTGVAADPGTAVQRPSDPEAEVSFTAPEAVRTRAFWLIGLGQAFAVAIVQAANVHMIPHLVDRLDMSLEAAGMMLGVMTGISILGLLVGGLAGDRLDKRLLSVLAMVGHALGMLALAYATSVWWVVFFAVVHGMAWGVRNPLVNSLRADYFGPKHFGSVMGVTMVILLIGNVGGPMLAGALADLTGDFRLGFTILAAMAGIGILCFVWLRRPAPPRRAASAKPVTAPQA